MKNKMDQTQYLLWRIVKKMVPVMMKTSPLLFPVCNIEIIAQALILGLTPLVTQKLFDSISHLALGEKVLATTSVLLILVIAMKLIGDLLMSLTEMQMTTLNRRARTLLIFEISEKIGRLPAITFEDTKKLDDINKANVGKNGAMDVLNTMINIVFFFLIYYIIISAYLFSVKPMFVLAILFVFIPTIISHYFRMKIYTQSENELANVRRENDYYEKCIVEREFFKETRLLGSVTYFFALLKDSATAIKTILFKANRKTTLMDSCFKLITSIGYLGILFMLFSALMKREITVGAFAAVFSAIGTVFNLTGELVDYRFGSIARQLGSIKNYFSFFDIQEHGGTIEEIPENFSIHLKNVSFKYPNATKNSIENLSLTIGDKETIAIVGENGSGKSTLCRLISGMYQPTEGTVCYNDKQTHEFKMDTLFKKTSAVFQMYNRYKLTLRENIKTSDFDADDGDLEKICTMASVDYASDMFTNGFETNLSREYNGIDLSGGQWQRVAIARAYFKEHDLIILDEPTAAIDPFEETKVYERFAELTRNKTSIIVTHRLGSVRLADRIIVMKEGSIVESGTHDTLMEVDGEYRKMYESQRQWYEDEQGLEA